ncbi:MAG: transglutaminase domain-containing protein [Tepidiformaceae bacterium]
MAGVNVRSSQSAPRRIGGAAINAPRLVMSWEDWLTLTAAVIAFLSVAYSIQQAHWVRNMPSLVPTALAGLLIGMLAARIKANALLIQPFALVLGLIVVVLVVQTYADGANVAERLNDFRFRMHEWYDVVRSGDISNDNLPFVTLVHSLCFLCAYLAAWSIYRWRNAWIAIIPAGIVLLANISFLNGQPSGAFVIFLFGAVLLIGRLHLQRSQLRWQKLGIDYPDFISLTAIQFTVALTTVLIIGAWLIPTGNEAGAASDVINKIVSPAKGHSGTLVRLFHNVDTQNGSGLHSFGDFLTIQGRIKLGTKDIFAITSTQPGLVRAQSYEEYTGAGWKTTNRQDTKIAAKDVALPPDGGGLEARSVSVVTVKVLDSDNTVLTPGTPIGTNVGSVVESPKGVPSEIERVRTTSTLKSGDTYNALGSQSTATVAQLLAAGTSYPDYIKQRYLQLPKELPQRVRDESARVAGQGGATPYEQATSIQTYLRTLPFDLDVDSAPQGRDTVDYFLFDLKKGYFDYQSSAMAVMLRTLGIPARVAVGYVLDPSSEVGTTFTVAKNNAYSWVEVYFPKYGWVNFNPTAGEPAGGAIDAIGAPTGSFGADPSPLDLEGLFPNIDPLEPDVHNPAVQALNQDATVHSEPPWLLIWSLGGALAAAVAVYVVGRTTWNRGTRGLEPSATMWAKVERAAGWAGLAANEAETPREWSRRLGGAIERPEDAKSLADAYEQARYGRPETKRGNEAEAQSAYKRLRNALFAAVFRRARKHQKP